jgi:uncharacterized integral membrane protein
MLRLLLAVVVTVAVVVFVMMNMHHVTLSFVVGPPVKIRLIFLLLSTYVVGIVTAAFVTMIWKLRMDKRRRSAPQHEAPAEK